MKILYVVELHHPHVGGVEALYKNLSEKLVKRGHKCTVLTSRLPNTKKEETINGVKIIRVNAPKFAARHFFSFLAVPKAIKLARSHDVLHTTTYNAAIPSRIASMITKIPVVITVHEVLARKWFTMTRINAFTAWLYLNIESMITNMKFDMFACPSDFTRKRCIQSGSDPSRTVTVHSGVDYDLFDPKKVDRSIRKKLKLEKNFTLISFGRPGLTKGIEFLVQAMPEIVEKVPDAKLLLLLADSPKDRFDYIKGLIRKLKLNDHIVLKKPVPRNELPSYIAAADCAVVPSLSEGFGLTVAESCAMDVPVVASDTDSIPEVVNNKFVLVEPGNPSSIAHGVEKVFKKQYTTSKKKFFTWDKVADNYFKIYEKIVHKR